MLEERKIEKKEGGGSGEGIKSSALQGEEKKN